MSPLHHGRDFGDCLSYFTDFETSVRPRMLEGLAQVLRVPENEAQICPLPNCFFLCPDIASNPTFISKRTRSWET